MAEKGYKGKSAGEGGRERVQRKEEKREGDNGRGRIRWAGVQREKVLHVNGLLGPFLCRTWGPLMRVLHAYGLLGAILCMTRDSQMRVLHGNSVLGPILCTTFSWRGVYC